MEDEGVKKLDAVWEVAIWGSSGQTTGTVSLIGGVVSSRAAAGWRAWWPFRGVRPMRSTVSLDNIFGSVRSALRTTIRIRRIAGATVVGVGVGVAVLLLGGSHSRWWIITDHVVSRRLDSGRYKVNIGERSSREYGPYAYTTLPQPF